MQRVRDALAPLKEQAARPDWESEVVAMRQARGTVDPWPLFAERLRLVNGTPLERREDWVTLLRAAAARRSSTVDSRVGGRSGGRCTSTCRMRSQRARALRRGSAQAAGAVLEARQRVGAFHYKPHTEGDDGNGGEGAPDALAAHAALDDVGAAGGDAAVVGEKTHKTGVADGRRAQGAIIHRTHADGRTTEEFSQNG